VQAGGRTLKTSNFLRLYDEAVLPQLQHEVRVGLCWWVGMLWLVVFVSLSVCLTCCLSVYLYFWLSFGLSVCLLVCRRV
jgi:hypothetical protein